MVKGARTTINITGIMVYEMNTWNLHSGMNINEALDVKWTLNFVSLLTNLFMEDRPNFLFPIFRDGFIVSTVRTCRRRIGAVIDRIGFASLDLNRF